MLRWTMPIITWSPSWTEVTSRPTPGHHTRRFMSQDHGHRRIWPPERVQLRVADATGEQFDLYLRRSRIGQVDVVDHHRLAELDVDGGLRLHTGDHI